MSVKKYKLDIFEVMTHINSCDFDYIDTLSKTQLDGFSPYIIQQWLKNSDKNSDYRLLLLDNYVNEYTFGLAAHPKLLYKLMCVSCGLHDDARYSFTKPIVLSLVHKTIMDYYNYNISYTRESLPLLSLGDIMDMGIDMGFDKKKLKDLENSYVKTI